MKIKELNTKIINANAGNQEAAFTHKMIIQMI